MTSLPVPPAKIAEVIRVLRGPSENGAADALNAKLAELGFPVAKAKRYDRRGIPARNQRAKRDAILQALVG